MPKTAKKGVPAKKDTTPRKTKTKKTCACCHEVKTTDDFYVSASPVFSLDQRVPFCKDCCKEYAIGDDGVLDYSRFKDMLMKCDKPLYYDLFDSAVKQVQKEYPDETEAEIVKRGREIVSNYFRYLSIKKYIGQSYTSSVKAEFMGTVTGKSVGDRQALATKYKRIFGGQESIGITSPVGVSSDDFEITPEVIELFGDGYSAMEYKKMFTKYQDLRQNYQIQTSLHKEALITYVRFKVKEEAATVNGFVDEARKWYNAAQDAADKAKLSPKQLTKADLQKGLNSFSEISQAMEQAVDIIEVLPRYKSQPVDSVDFNIWCYINYARKLKGMPIVDYPEVYKFYDDMKDNYLSQYGDPYGIFTEDATVKNRENVEKFITLPADYNDIESDVDDDDEGDDE